MGKNNIHALIDILASSILSIKDAVDCQFYDAVELLSKCAGKIIVVGIGKSGYIGMKAVSTMLSLGIQCAFLHPSEAVHGDFGLISSKDILILLSNSGESVEIIPVALYARQHNNKIISITRNGNSSIAKLSYYSISIKQDPEINQFNAPTTSSLQMLALLDLLAVLVSNARGFGVEDYARLHPGGKLGLQLRKTRSVISKNITPVLNIANNSEVISMIDIIDKINDGKSGFVAICLNGIPHAIVTDGDVRRLIIKNHLLPVRDMFYPVPTLPAIKTVLESDNLLVVKEMFQRDKIGSLLVTSDDKKLVGHIDLKEMDF